MKSKSKFKVLYSPIILCICFDSDIELKAKLAVKSQQSVSPRSHHVPRLRFDDLLRKQASHTSPRVQSESWGHVSSSSPRKDRDSPRSIVSPREKTKPPQKSNHATRNNNNFNPNKLTPPIDLHDLDAIIANAKGHPELNRMDSGHVDMHLENLISGRMSYYGFKNSASASPSSSSPTSPHSESSCDNVSSSDSSGSSTPTYASGMSKMASNSGSNSSRSNSEPNSSRGPSMSTSPSSSRSPSPGPNYGYSPSPSFSPGPSYSPALSFSPGPTSPIPSFSSSPSPGPSVRRYSWQVKK